MTPDKLTDLAQRLRDHAATLAPNATREDMIEAARYLRECAQAEPAATVRVHNTGGNAGIAWSGVPTENAGTMRGGTPLYTHPQPKQADAVDALRELVAAHGAQALDAVLNSADQIGAARSWSKRRDKAWSNARAVLAAQGGKDE